MSKKYVSIEKLGLYDSKIKGVISAGDEAALNAAKAYADGLATNYDAAGSAASALAEAKTYADGKDTAIQAAQAAAEAAASAASVADGKAVAAQNDVDALELYVGTIPEGATATNVVAYIQEKTSGIASEGAMTELGNRVGIVEGKVATIEGDYLKAADKTELEGKITTVQTAAEGAQSYAEGVADDLAEAVESLEGAIALKADQTALDAVSLVANAAATKAEFDAAVEALEGEDERIEGLVTAEVAKAREEEGKLAARLVKVETFFEKAEDETISEALDTLVEIQKYITDEGAAADQMVLDIAANAKAIEDHIATDHDFAGADAALKSELNGEIAKKADKTTVEGIDGRLTTAEGTLATAVSDVSTLKGQMTEVQGAVATKAEQSALESAVSTLTQADTGLGNRITALEGRFTGEGSVEGLIATAKQEAIDAAAADATTKANTAESNAKAEATRLNGLMNTRVEALEAIDHDHSNKALLDTYTQTEANLADAVAKKHAHSNFEVLEGITSAKVTAWDAAEGNAKTYADGLNTSMNTRVLALETWHNDFSECSEDDIKALFN